MIFANVEKLFTVCLRKFYYLYTYTVSFMLNLGIQMTSHLCLCFAGIRRGGHGSFPPLAGLTDGAAGKIGYQLCIQPCFHQS